MNLIDWILVALVVIFALIGWRTGFVVGLLSFLGFVALGIVAAQFVPELVASWQIENPWRLVLIIGLVLLAAGIGQALGALAGRRLRDTVSWQPAQWLDSLLGAVLAACEVVLAAWLIGTAVLAAPAGGAASPVRSSTVLAQVDSAMPGVARDLLTEMQKLVDDSGLPRIMGGFYSMPQGDPPPATWQALPAGVRAALPSVVQVVGDKPACGSGATGSGYVSTPEHVTTNAHVVSAMTAPTVRSSDGESYEAVVVAFDPQVDVAVLYVPGLPMRAIPTKAGAGAGTPAAVAGYPGGGPLAVGGARIRDEIGGRQAVGTDIYGNPGVSRQVFVLSATVRPGNSGGPLLALDGSVLGLVFAQAKEESDVGFALTAEQFRTTSRAAGSSVSAVDTGPCPVQ